MFMSDTTNVMKVARSGVQKLIRSQCPYVHDVSCVCHLADLSIKVGMESLPVGIDQLFVDVFYYFYHSSKRQQEFCDLWCSLFTTEPQTILKPVLPGGLACCDVWVAILINLMV